VKFGSKRANLATLRGKPMVSALHDVFIKFVHNHQLSRKIFPM